MKTQVKRSHVHRTQKQWQQLVGEFDPSQQTVHAFCKKHNIGTSSFYKWKAKFHVSNSIDTREVPVFVPIQPLPDSKIQQTPEWDLELELGHGIVLRLSKS